MGLYVTRWSTNFTVSTFQSTHRMMVMDMCIVDRLSPGLMEDSASVKSNDSATVSDEYEFVASTNTVSREL